MNAAFVPSGDITAFPAALPRPPPPPPRPPRPPRPPPAPASAALGTPGQFECDASQTVRVLAAGSTSTNSALFAPVRYQNRSSGSHVAAAFPPTTRPLSDGPSILTARS